MHAEAGQNFSTKGKTKRRYPQCDSGLECRSKSRARAHTPALAQTPGSHSPSRSQLYWAYWRHLMCTSRFHAMLTGGNARCASRQDVPMCSADVQMLEDRYGLERRSKQQLRHATRRAQHAHAVRLGVTERRIHPPHMPHTAQPIPPPPVDPLSSHPTSHEPSPEMSRGFGGCGGGAYMELRFKDLEDPRTFQTICWLLGTRSDHRWLAWLIAGRVKETRRTLCALQLVNCPFGDTRFMLAWSNPE